MVGLVLRKKEVIRKIQFYLENELKIFEDTRKKLINFFFFRNCNLNFKGDWDDDIFVTRNEKYLEKIRRYV